ncbi:MAG: hypothetical protein AB1558_09910 [Thermodesulfobacteriota bacterium]
MEKDCLTGFNVRGVLAVDMPANWVVAYLLASMAAAYWLFSLLLRVPVMNSIFTHRTLTHIFRRYHEPETKARDLLGGGKRGSPCYCQRAKCHVNLDE